MVFFNLLTEASNIENVQTLSFHLINCHKNEHIEVITPRFGTLSASRNVLVYTSIHPPITRVAIRLPSNRVG